MKVFCLLPPGFHRYYRECSEPRVQRQGMKLRVFAVLIVLGASPLSSTAIPTQAPATANPPPVEKVYDVTSFAAELRRLEAELQKKPSPTSFKDLRDGLPPSWNVSTPERRYSISTKPLRDQLNENPADNALTWIDHLQLEVQSAQRAEGQPPAAA